MTISMGFTAGAVIAVAVLTAGCEGAARPQAFVIPGPTVPSPLPTEAP